MKTTDDIFIGACSSPDEMVAYLYGEMDPDGRFCFETHLADCDLCTEAFAGISLARLDVYEWNRDVFAEIPTPHFEIPYPVKAENYGWMDALRGLFGTHRQWAFSGAAFALAVMIFGVVIFSSLRNSDEMSVASNNEATIADLNRAANDPVADREITKAAEPQLSEGPAAVTANYVPNKEKRPSRTVQRQAPQRNVSRPAARPIQAEFVTAPRLNDFEDDDDNTIRLGDLLADMDTRN